MSRVARPANEAEIAALEQLCDKLSAFGADIALEWLDGAMTALVASRRLIPMAEWRPLLLGDSFERAFADPQDAAQAQAVLDTHWARLTSQLDAESIIDAPDDLRLSPLMVSYDDAARAEVVAAGHMDAAEAENLLQTGALWAEGFREAIEAFADDWPEPDVDTEDGRWLDDCLTRVGALSLPQDALVEHLATEYPGETLTRDQLVDEALFGAQDLRVYWLDHAPKPETRRVEALPGRNDPCHCGSGKKFKKCHGQ